MTLKPNKRKLQVFSTDSFQLQTFKRGFDEVIQKYVMSKNTPVRPSKKKAKGRIEKLDNQGKCAIDGVNLTQHQTSHKIQNPNMSPMRTNCCIYLIFIGYC